MTDEVGWPGGGTICLQTLGCRLNQAETEFLTQKLLEAGYRVVDPDHASDIYLLNTCTVTRVADQKCRKLLRSMRKRNPRTLIVATGCYAERAPEEVGSIPGVDMVIPNSDKERLPDILPKRPAASSARLHEYSCSRRTRAMVKIQEGCSRPCSFCIVPLVRGPEKTRPLDQIIGDIKEKSYQGYREVLLTGTRLGYPGGAYLPGLIRRILQETAIERLRLSSLEPADLKPDLLKLWQDKRLCPHIHLCLQSGSDSVLKRMRRAYSTHTFASAAELAREYVPTLALTTDIMVGFPGETEEEFAESYSYCRTIDFAGMHVFSYSPRPGTEAALMPAQVPETIKKKRSGLMLDLARRNSRRFRESLLGGKMDVLFESARNGLWYGLTGNYVRVSLQSRENLANRLLTTSLIGVEDSGLRGMPI
ncbi:MAG: tRNA (N(6)-L-threonylcarbamoyladenosine(37)-C(2))-methylthiotransferase MtaB [Dehalococcoidia bacterium]|nr:tRNA (N(6)-L-threonylcarbamoyladenosine(37)-C(2))-methylthiotransferase MtaB [Dehalococcoidia bacterium]